MLRDTTSTVLGTAEVVETARAKMTGRSEPSDRLTNAQCDDLCQPLNKPISRPVNHSSATPEHRVETATVGHVMRWFKVDRSVAERVMNHARKTCGVGHLSVSEFHAWVRDCERRGADLAGPRIVPERENRRGKRVGLIYFIEAVGCDRIKIGFTGARTAEERLRGLQTASPFELHLLATMPGTMADEMALHARFASSRVLSCTEWFYATQELRALIAEKAT